MNTVKHESLENLFEQQRQLELQQNEGDLTSLVMEQGQVFIRFSIGENPYISPIAKVKEVLDERDITPFPVRINEYRGIINLRGSILPIYQLQIATDITRDAHRRIIVLEVADNLYAGIIASDIKRVFIPFEEGNNGQLANNDVITYEGIPIKYFDAQSFFMEKVKNYEAR